MRPDIDFNVDPFVRYDRLPCFVQQRMRAVFIRVSACDTVDHPVGTGGIYCPVNTRLSPVVKKRHAEPDEIIARLALNVIIRQELRCVYAFHKNEFIICHADVERDDHFIAGTRVIRASVCVRTFIGRNVQRRLLKEQVRPVLSDTGFSVI